MIGLMTLIGQTQKHTNIIGIDANTDHKHAPTDTVKSQSAQNGSGVLFNIIICRGLPGIGPLRHL